MVNVKDFESAGQPSKLSKGFSKLGKMTQKRPFDLRDKSELKPLFGKQCLILPT
jgi:hypothetical protein